MIFQHTWEKVLSGEKTQTRRIVKPGDAFTTPLSMGIIGPHRGRVVTTLPNYARPPRGFDNIYSVMNGKRTVYQVGKTYAVQSGRGQKAVARIRILSIKREDVREISDEDVKAEGFESRVTFFKVWCDMHDSEVLKHPMEWVMENAYLWLRPAECYEAWALTFEVVK